MKERIAEKPQADGAAPAVKKASGMGEIEMPAGTDPAMSAETPPDMTDDELVAAARAGDESAFGRLFERHRRLVSRLAYRFFPRRDQVEEIIQESFIKAYFALGDYQGGGEKSFVSWLARI